MDVTPFFTGDGPSPTGDRRRLLLVSYHFPPSPAVGGLRWQKFSRHLSERGWDLDVLTLDPAALDDTDPARLDDLPPGIRLFAVASVRSSVDRLEDALRRALDPFYAGFSRPSTEDDGSGDDDGAGEEPVRPSSLRREEILDGSPAPRDAYRAFRAVVRHLEEGRWAARAAKRGARLAADTDYRAVVSSGPPHSAHRAARRVAARTGTPLVLDFRDPWSLAERVPEHVAVPLWLRLCRRAEERCVGDARLVVLNTEPHREAMEALHPEAADRLVVAMNGFDEEDRPGVPSTAGFGAAGDGGSAAPADSFRVVYAGTVYGSRDPRPFFAAAGRLVEARGLSPDDFRIDFLGHAEEYGGRPVAELAGRAGLGEHFTAHGPRPRDDALAACADAAVLLSLPQDTGMCIPAKIFEYMLFESWLLALEPPGTATERVLRDTRADVVAPGDVEGIRTVLGRRHRQWRDGRRPGPVCRDERYSRRAQARRLLREIEERTGA